MRLLIRLFFGVALFGSSLQPLAASPPNVVLIVTDDLGYGDVGCYGSREIPTPRMDRMAREGIRLTRCYAPASTCTPTRYAIMTGEYAWRQTKRKTTILDGDAPLAIAPGRATLPEVLRRGGYDTALLGKWHLGIGDGQRPVDFNAYVGPGPLEVGFDEAFYIPATVDRVPCVFIENHAVFHLDAADPIQISYLRQVGELPTGRERPDLLKYPADRQHSDTIINGISRIGYMSGGTRAHWVDEEITDVLARRAARFIGREREKPFFLMLGTHDPHVPHAPHPRFAGKSQAGMRGDSIVQTDWLVGAVLDAIEQAGLDQETLVILTSDNGPTVFDGYFDGSVAQSVAHRPAGELRGGKYLVYEGGCRVPCIVRWPGRVAAGDSAAFFTLTDLLPSLAAICGIEALQPGSSPDGLDLSAVLLDPAAKSHRNEAVLQGIFSTLALVEEGWKFIPGNADRLAEGMGRGADPRDTRFRQARIERDELYDLHADPQETTNVIDDHREKATELADALARIVGQR
jgi:arylsulfatase A-like enzyme